MSTGTEPAATERERLHSLAATLLERDAWSREHLLSHQRERLTALLRHAVGASPYYRETLGHDAGGADVDLTALPILSKVTMMEQFDRIVTDPRLRRVELESFVARGDTAGLLLGDYHVFGTSGTTGVPGIFAFSRDEFSVWVAAALRAISRMGATPHMRLAAIGAPAPVHVTRKLFAAFQAGRQGSPELSVLTPLDTIVATLNEYQPEAVTTYAGVASLLADEALQGRLAIRPSIVGVGSEVLTEDAEQRIVDAWGIRPFNVYAATEAPQIASASTDHVGLHIAEDLVIVEVVDEHGRSVPPGEPGSRVLLTNLVNHAQPLIRYELSDSVVLDDGPDPSGRPYLRIARVDGRSDDVLRLPAVGGGEVAVDPFRLRAPFVRLNEVRQYQVVHRDDGLVVRIVLRDTAPRDLPGRVHVAVASALADAGAKAELDVEVVAEIQREPGPAAKVKLVRSEVATVT